MAHTKTTRAKVQKRKESDARRQRECRARKRIAMAMKELQNYSWKKVQDGRMNRDELELLVERQAHGDAAPRPDSWEY